MFKTIKNLFGNLLIIVGCGLIVGGSASAVTRIMVPQGGTGQGSFEAGAYLIGNGTGAIATTTDVSAGDMAQLGQIGDVATTTLATGYMLHYDGSNWISSSTPYINASTGCVGIGTTTACCKLCVDGNIRTTDTFYGNTWSSYDGNSMAIQPTDDTDDFFSFKTPSDRPTIKREGGKFIYFESSNVYDVGISFRADATYSGTLNYEKDGHIMTMLGKTSPLGFKANSDYDDYIKIQTASNIPEITVASSSALKINAGGTNSLLLNHSGGYVGIGTTSPLSQFSMNSGTNGFRIDSSGIIQQGTWEATPIDMSSYTNLTVSLPLTYSSDNLNINDATTGADGVVKLATITETSTGTEESTVVTPDGLAGSIFGEKNIETILVASDTANAAATSTYQRIMPATLNGFNVVDAICGSQNLATSTVRLVRNRAGTEAYVFSTDITVTGERYATDETINTSNDDIQTGDIFYWVILASATPAGNGLTCSFTARKP